MVEGTLSRHKEFSGHFADPPWNRDSEAWLRLDDELPHDHLARRIDLAVEMLDLQPLFALYFGVGKKACRPDLLLKVVLFELERGQQSPAEWHLHLKENNPVRWLAMGMKPSRQTVYAFRDRCGPFLEQANQQILEMALEVGVTKATRGALDGSTVAACATRRHFAKESVLAERTEELKQALQADRSDTPIESRPGWMAPTPVGRTRQWWSFDRVREMLDRRQRENELRPSSKQKPRDKVMVSWSDPEAVLGSDKYSVFRPLYNLQVIQDLDSPLVLAYDVFAQQNDVGTLMPLVERMTEFVGHKPNELLTDSGYVSVREVESCELAGIVLYAPCQENDYSKTSKKAKPVTQIPKSQFIWLPDQHSYQCPEGHLLLLAKTSTQKRAEGQEVGLELFTCPPQHCLGCARQETCTSNPKKGRTVSRIKGEEYVEGLRARMQTQEAKRLYRLRRQTVELRFADVKEHRKLRRFTGRGLARVKIQIAANVLVHNLLTVARYADEDRVTDVDSTALGIAA